MSCLTGISDTVPPIGLLRALRMVNIGTHPGHYSSECRITWLRRYDAESQLDCVLLDQSSEQTVSGVMNPRTYLLGDLEIRIDLLDNLSNPFSILLDEDDAGMIEPLSLD